MSQHNIETELENASMTSTLSLLKTPEGLALGVGTTVGNGIEGWAPGAIFIDTDASTGSQVWVNTGTSAAASWTEIADAGVAGGFTMDDAADIAVNTTTGTNIGTAVGQKLGFWAVTPVVQPASGDQADQGVMTTVGSNTGTAAAGLSLIGDTTAVDQAANIMNDLVALQEDIAALDTLVTAIRTALVNTGIMKGAA